MPEQIIILQLSEERLRQIIAEEIAKISITPKQEPINGLEGLAKYFGCSKTKAQSIKNRMPKDCYIQDGRMLQFDPEKLKTIKLKSFKK